MATLADVARHAGVAASTVSYVLSGKRSVSDETKDRVNRAIKELKYHPNAGARALASSRSNVLALIVPLRSDMYVPVMMEIAIGVVTQARGYGYDVLLLTNDEGTDGIRRVVSSARADAMILTDIGLDDDRIAGDRGGRDRRRADRRPRRPGRADCVDLDFAAAGRLCVEHLAAARAPHMAFLGEAEAVYQRHIGFAARTLAASRTPRSTVGVDLVHRPCNGSLRGRRRRAGPDSRGAAAAPPGSSCRTRASSRR